MQVQVSHVMHHEVHSQPMSHLPVPMVRQGSPTALSSPAAPSASELLARRLNRAVESLAGGEGPGADAESSSSSAAVLASSSFSSSGGAAAAGSAAGGPPAAGGSSGAPPDDQTAEATEGFPGMYGKTSPLIVGLDTCGRFRDEQSPGARVFAAPAGLFNTGTNLLEVRVGGGGGWGRGGEDGWATGSGGGLRSKKKANANAGAHANDNNARADADANARPTPTRPRGQHDRLPPTPTPTPPRALLSYARRPRRRCC